MGAYLSEPITDKISSDEANERLAWGTSSMQGWRISQEDAHNCITEYDENTSYFAVYDGHGGSEVATYCSRRLPDFIKKTEAYKNGDISQALVDGYLGFDGTIVTKDVIKILKELAGNKQGEEAVEEQDEDDDDNVTSLRKEAHMPLEEVMAKYKEKGMIFRLVRDNKGIPLSPFLKGKGRKRKDDAAGSSGDGLDINCESLSSVNDDVSSSTNNGNKLHPGGDAQVSTSNGETKSLTADSGSSKQSHEISVQSSSKSSNNSSLPDSSNDNCSKPASSAILTEETETKEIKDDSNGGPTTSDVPKESNEVLNCNGDVTESTKSTDGNVSSSSQENDGHKKDIKGKGKAKATVSSTENADKTEIETSTTSPERTKRAASLYNNLLNRDEADDDESDSNDETFEGQEEPSSSDENEVNGVEDESSEDDDAENEEESSEDDDDDDDDDDCNDEADYDDVNLTGSDEPGMDSGCTAVVAILRGDHLHVANAGDSRCVVCRDGQAIDMSLDHKPEDPLELARVTKAGGNVNGDGRINGGLNLSRAIGDHSYKQNKDLDDKEQMITALPDIKTLAINPEKDKFMILACDGIWNFMTSQEVIDFVAERIDNKDKSLSQICEELFDKCLAPSTVGDGTGCDNMTAIIIKFGATLSSAGGSSEETTKKRPADNEEVADESAAKRQKTDEEAAVSSSE